MEVFQQTSGKLHISSSKLLQAQTTSTIHDTKRQHYLSLVLLNFNLLKLMLEIQIDISLHNKFLVNNYSFSHEPSFSIAKFIEL